MIQFISHEPRRHRGTEKEQKFHRFSPCLCVSVADLSFGDWGLSRQIIQLGADDFDGLRRRAEAAITRDFRAFVNAESENEFSAVHVIGVDRGGPHVRKKYRLLQHDMASAINLSSESSGKRAIPGDISLAA